jgi:hypothetical protein
LGNQGRGPPKNRAPFPFAIALLQCSRQAGGEGAAMVEKRLMQLGANGSSATARPLTTCTCPKLALSKASEHEATTLCMAMVTTWVVVLYVAQPMLAVPVAL